MIYLRNISLHFGARTLFDDVSLAIKPGEKIGLIGRNGSGKSTLLRLLSGDLRSDGGAIEMPSGLRIGFLTQTVDLDLNKTPVDICSQAFSELTNIESEIKQIEGELHKATDHDVQIELAGQLSNLYERQALLGNEQKSGEIEKVLKGMGFEEDGFRKPLSTFSGGWRMRVELSRLLLTRPDLLLLDEPTNHLDIESILWFIKYLKEYEGTVILVSHDQHFLDRATTRTLEVELRSIQDYPFPYHKAMAAKEEMQEIKEAAYDNQQRVIAHKERLIEKFRAKASKAKFAKALQTELSRMDMIELDESDSKAMKLRFEQGHHSGKVVYQAKHLEMAFGQKVVIRDLDLTIDRGTRIAFVGQNGQGKTTLAKLMAGIHSPTGGTLDKGINVMLGYYAQDEPDKIPRDKLVIDVLRDAAPKETEGRLRSVLGSMLFSGDDVDKKCSVLSGGERARLAFSCMILSPSNVLILDEPTNHLDIQSKEILKQALLSYEGTLIVVSHDLYFLQKLTNHTLEFADGKIQYHLYDIDQFLDRREVDNLQALELRKKVPGTATAEPVLQKKHTGGDRKALQRKIQNIERAIEKLEKEKTSLESEMASTDFYTREDAGQRTERYQEVLGELSDKMESWDKLASEWDTEDE